MDADQGMWTLRQLEWSGSAKGKECCPLCGARKVTGEHQPGCKMLDLMVQWRKGPANPPRVIKGAELANMKADLEQHLNAPTVAAATSQPQQAQNPDWTALREICREYMDFEHSEEWHEDEDDYNHWITEAALKALYGEGIFEYLSDLHP